METNGYSFVLQGFMIDFKFIHFSALFRKIIEANCNVMTRVPNQCTIKQSIIKMVSSIGYVLLQSVDSQTLCRPDLFVHQIGQSNPVLSGDHVNPAK